MANSIMCPGCGRQLVICSPVVDDQGYREELENIANDGDTGRVGTLDAVWARQRREHRASRDRDAD